MQALLEHSVQNYGPLPSELRLRRVRSRTQSRPSPYPARSMKIAPRSPAKLKTEPVHVPAVHAHPVDKSVLQQLPINHNIPAISVLNPVKPLSPLIVKQEPKRENAFGLAPNARPRVGSTARRTALGWSKRSNGKTSSDLKENVGQGTIMTYVSSSVLVIVCLTICDATLVPASRSESTDLVRVAARHLLLRHDPSGFETATSSVPTRPLCHRSSSYNRHQHKKFLHPLPSPIHASLRSRRRITIYSKCSWRSSHILIFVHFILCFQCFPLLSVSLIFRLTKVLYTYIVLSCALYVCFFCVPTLTVN